MNNQERLDKIQDRLNDLGNTLWEADPEDGYSVVKSLLTLKEVVKDLATVVGRIDEK
jgi:hypothetical protein